MPRLPALVAAAALLTTCASPASGAILSPPKQFPYPPTVAVSPAGDWVLAFGPDVSPGPVRAATGSFPTAPTAKAVRELDTPQGAIVIGVAATPDGTRSVAWIHDVFDEETGVEGLTLAVATLRRGAARWSTQRLAFRAPIFGTIVRATPDGGLAAAWTDAPKGAPERVMVAVRRPGAPTFGPPRVAHTDAEGAEAVAAELIGDGGGGLTAVVERGEARESERPTGRTVGLAQAAADAGFGALQELRRDCHAATGAGRADGGAALAVVCARKVGTQQRLDVRAATRTANGAFGPLARVSNAAADGDEPDLVLGSDGRVTVAWLRRPSPRRGGRRLPWTRVEVATAAFGAAFTAPRALSPFQERVLAGPQLLAGPRGVSFVFPGRDGLAVLREVEGSGARRLSGAGLDVSAAVDAHGRGIAGGSVGGRAAAVPFRLPG